MREPEEPAHAVHHRHHRRVHQPPLPELADVQLHVGALHTPTNGSSPRASHQENHSRSWNAYKRCVRPEYRARNETAANCAVDIEAGWNGKASRDQT